jgi:hypothetical protein
MLCCVFIKYYIPQISLILFGRAFDPAGLDLVSPGEGSRRIGLREPCAAFSGLHDPYRSLWELHYEGYGSW